MPPQRCVYRKCTALHLMFILTTPSLGSPSKFEIVIGFICLLTRVSFGSSGLFLHASCRTKEFQTSRCVFIARGYPNTVQLCCSCLSCTRGVNPSATEHTLDYAVI